MKQSQLFTKTSKQIPSGETSRNAQLLIQAGFVQKELAGAYVYFPLGLRVLNKVNTVIREEMNAAGGQELFMTALQDKGIWEASGRWSDDVVDNWFKTSLKSGAELGLAFTHEEPLAKHLKQFVSSYKDLPFSVYQIQVKYRNELRAKAGLLRGREFYMKDLYSFSKDKEEHEVFYEKMKDVYMRVFDRLGLGDKTYITISNGGSFSKYSYEFQTICEAGEDVIYVLDEKERLAINKDDVNAETLKDFGVEVDIESLQSFKSIEVGDIYSLGTKFSEPADLMYTGEDGKKHPVYMGSYGMSPTRLLGTIVEAMADDKGMVWPKDVAPFTVHLLSLSSKDEAVQGRIDSVSTEIYDELTSAGVEVLWDDRDISPGAKFGDSDLIGIPLRLVVSSKTLEQDSVEWKERHLDAMDMLNVDAVIEKVKSFASEGAVA